MRLHRRRQPRRPSALPRPLPWQLPAPAQTCKVRFPASQEKLDALRQSEHLQVWLGYPLTEKSRTWEAALQRSGDFGAAEMRFNAPVL